MNVQTKLFVINIFFSIFVFHRIMKDQLVDGPMVMMMMMMMMMTLKEG